MKTDVHRHVRRDAQGKKVVTIEGMDVCMKAWMYIVVVSEATFYRHQTFANEGKQSLMQKNTGTIKTREHSVQATATVEVMFESTSDHMPNRSRTVGSGEKVVTKMLLAAFTYKKFLEQVNGVNAAFELKEVSTLNLSKIKETRLAEFAVKLPGDNFARCSTCNKLHALIKGAIPGSQKAIKFVEKMDKHLAVARAHRKYYYANSYRSHTFPHEILTIVHDKMDLAKTASLIFSHKNKDLDGLMKMPLSVTGMIGHGHGDVWYAHYGLGLFSYDSNYTIGSMTKLLQDLELPPKSSFRELFVGSKSSALFATVLSGSEMCKVSLPPLLLNLVLATPLPSILHVQIDNATGDDKKQYIFCFWSLLVAKNYFFKTFVNFMIVSHMHDDINALFERWSMLLKKKNYPTILALTKSFMDIEATLVIPHLIEEVPNFKRFIAGKFHDGEDMLVSHTKPQQVKFYLDSNRNPIMKYKLLCTHLEWLVGDGRGIKLWRVKVH